MSMNRESTSLKKSSSDYLKLANQWYSIWEQDAQLLQRDRAAGCVI